MPKTKRKKSGKPITSNTIHRDRNAKGPALIRKFHTLQTALSSAINAGDTTSQATLEAEIEKLGGLPTYQKASIQGQDKRRGGDSSKQLLDWLKLPEIGFASEREKMRVLEIGSLSTENYISKSPKLQVTRIDLNAQHHLITQQDFLDRPAPASPEEQFEGISCSLVLNFVPSSQRSDFLLHLTKFLPVSDELTTRWLFFVTPAPCINNSRYMNKTVLLRMFETLGFEVVREKVTDRIGYWLFKRVKEVTPEQSYRKVELQSGKTRNNFFIALKT